MCLGRNQSQQTCSRCRSELTIRIGSYGLLQLPKGKVFPAAPRRRLQSACLSLEGIAGQPCWSCVLVVCSEATPDECLRTLENLDQSRYAIRYTEKHPTFTREGLKQIAASEHWLRVGEEGLVNRDEVVDAMDSDAEE